MCYGDDALPPAPPNPVPVDQHAELLLRSVDGTEFAAHHAQPATPTDIGVVVLPDVRGLHGFYRDLTRRFAEAGMHCVAIDYFGRTAGLGPRDEGFAFREHVDRLEPQRTAEDVAAAVDWLRGAAPSVRSVFTVGFCMGGALSWAQSANSTELAGCVGFYGIPSRVVDRVPEMRAPLLLLAAGQDFTPVSEVESFAERVRAAGCEAELHVYPDAPHSYFDRGFGEHRQACEDSWTRILDFTARHRG